MTRINWKKYDLLLKDHSSAEVARIIGCHPSSVKQRRTKVGIPSPGKESERRNKELEKNGLRWCSGCEQGKPFDEFGFRSERKFAAYCKSCKNRKAKQSRDRQQNLTLRRKLGEDEHIYWQLLDEQNGVCAICGKANGKLPLFIDHDHKTKRVRGLLCRRCNSGLGILGDTENILEKALDYVRKSKTRTDLPTLRD